MIPSEQPWCERGTRVRVIPAPPRSGFPSSMVSWSRRLVGDPPYDPFEATFLFSWLGIEESFDVEREVDHGGGWTETQRFSMCWGLGDRWEFI